LFRKGKTLSLNPALVDCCAATKTALCCIAQTGNPAGATQETAMYTINDQFAKASRQFADNAAQANRLLLQNAENAFALQLAVLEENTNAAFAFIGEVVEARDFDALKTVWPKGLQVARESVERNVGTAQEVFGNSLKAGEAIGRIAKGQFETAAADVQAEVGKATKAAAGKKAR
jgi:hypothetical protein